MYRTEKTKELVLKGIPESMRGELWLLFSGEGREVLKCTLPLLGTQSRTAPNGGRTLHSTCLHSIAHSA